MEAFDFFISHNRKDNAIIEPVVDILRKKGYSCWFDKDQTDPNFMISFLRGVKNSKRFLFFLSVNSLQAYYCEREVKIASDICDEKDKNFIQVYKLTDINRSIECNTNVMLLTIAPCDVKNAPASAIADQIIRYNADIIPTNGANAKKDDTTYVINDVEERRIKLSARIFANAIRSIYDKILKDLSDPKILDLGSSSGDEMLNVLSSEGRFTLIGIDNDERAIEEGNKKDSRAKFYNMDVTSSDFINNLKKVMTENNIEKFDVINISLLLLVLKNNEPSILLKKIKDVLNDDGYLVITEYENSFGCASYDEHGYFAKLSKMFEIDTDCGDVHFGRKVYKLLYDAGYDKISIEKCGFPYTGYNEDEKKDIFDIEFSFLEDDMKRLSEINPDKKEFKQSYEWLKENLEKAKEEFLKPGFLYFSGYTVLTAQK